MDTNARKNRSGQIMENEIASILKANGIPYSSQVKSITFPDLKDKLGKDVKKFDFSIRTTRKTYLLEVNFYNGGGSKPNEVARAYTGIAPKINSNPKYEFVWITDGQGWFDAKPEIKAAYDVIPSIYNLTSLPNFLKKIKDEGFVTDSLF
jgi:type II restriction enzyme